MSEKPSVLFVCLGNICRSTMAEGVLQHLASNPPYAGKLGPIDSCGTGSYHIGDEPDDRTMAALESHGIKDYVHLGRKIKLSDFTTFDYIFGMDRANLSDLNRLQRQVPGSKAKILLFGEYSGTGKAEVMQDPYYGADNGFDVAYEQSERFCRNFLQSLFPDAE